MEKVIETKMCKCGEKFDITDKDLEFYDKISPIFDGMKYSIPFPTLCPDCRLQRRLSFRNERKLYKRKCDLTGNTIISMFSSDSQYKIFGINEWWSDKWNPLDYGQEFDFSKSFFEQWDSLNHKVPKVCLGGSSNENSEYTNFAMFSKDCYLIMSGRDNENCFYSRNIRDCQNIVDCLQIVKSNSVFNSTACGLSTKVFNSFHIFNCSDSNYLYFCDGCSNCFGCINLTNKSYHIFNIPYSPEDYLIELKKLNALDKKELQTIINKFILTHPRRALNIFGNEGTVTNDYIRNSKNVKNSTFIAECQNIANSFEQEKSNDIYDCCMGGGGNQLMYESMAIGMDSFRSAFCLSFTGLKETYYSEFCFNSSNLFGCIGLRNKEYCILNKQYTKEEYETLVPKIIEHMKTTGEWGEFFPSSISPFGYNETVANEYFPLEKNIALMNGFKWSDYEAPFPKVEKTIPASKLPDDISSIPDDILNWAIECEVSGKPFRIIKQELEFYRKHGLPIPKRHPDVRHMDRMKLRNPRKLYDRKCDKCSIDIKTTYSPERPEIVYCEECYNKDVV